MLRYKNNLIALAIFVLALAVRLPSLGVFFTADEFLWVDRSRNFLGSMVSPEFTCMLPDRDKTNAVPGNGLACTLRTGHPGVITMWTGASAIFGQWLTRPAEDTRNLLDFVQQMPTNPVREADIGPMRLPSVILTSLFVAIFFLLFSQLFHSGIATLAALLIALNPFHVALSRVIHHDALSTNFILTSTLSLIIYLAVKPHKKWLVLSGIMAGLGMLTKLTGFFMIPYFGLLSLLTLLAIWARGGSGEGFIESKPDDNPQDFSLPQPLPLGGESDASPLVGGTEGGRKPQVTESPESLNSFSGGALEASLIQQNIPVTKALIRLLADGLIWLGLALVTYVALWPALWVIPSRVFNTLFSIGTKYASTPHAKGVFFLGEPIREDPGLLFYPVVWLFRSPVWSMVGVVVALSLFFVGLFKRQANENQTIRRSINRLSPRGFQDQTGLLIWVGLFIFFFAITLMIGVDKKLDRYSLPIYPMLDLIAAIGLLTLIRHRVARGMMVSLILVVNLGLIYATAPYHFSYYNPLMGGMSRAVQAITVGWGEGMNLAADYLNQKPDAANMKVSSWYGSTFAPFFDGTTIPYSDQKGKALGGEYVVFYLNQRQREYPDQEIWRYLEGNYHLEETISLGGANYAWVFKGPGIDHYVEDQRYKGIAELLGWEWGPRAADGSLSPDAGAIPSGDALPFTLYWEYLGKSPEEQFFVRLLSPDGQIWAEGTTRPTEAYADTATWRQGQIIQEQGVLSIPQGTPPGLYTLQIGFYTQAPAVTSGELIFPTAVEPMDEPLQVIEIAPSLREGNPAGGRGLLGLSQISGGISGPNDSKNYINIDATWLLPEATTQNYQASFVLIDETEEVRWAWGNTEDLVPFLPTSQWPINRPILTKWQLPVTSQTPGGDYFVQMILTDQLGNIVKPRFGKLTLPGRSRNFIDTAPSQKIEATFASAIHLHGLDLSTETLAPNELLTVNLHWQATDLLDKDYTVFLQLLAPDGSVIAQQDKAPLDGQAPTSTWTPSEFINDTFQLQLPENLPAGQYRLITGFYQFETGERLTVTEGGAGDFVEVWTSTKN
ncbi:MAG: glycosyltransferase family 39 protein [Chloroflexota bacterium]